MDRGRNRITEPGRPHFVTCTVPDWLPVSTRPETVGIVGSMPGSSSAVCRFAGLGPSRFGEPLPHGATVAGLVQDVGGIQVLYGQVNPCLLGGAGCYSVRIQYIHLNRAKRGYAEVPELWRYSNAGDDVRCAVEVSRKDAAQERRGLHSHGGPWEREEREEREENWGRGFRLRWVNIEPGAATFRWMPHP
jgi:hypothetical protein